MRKTCVWDAFLLQMSKAWSKEPQLMMSFVVGCFLGFFAWFGIVSLWHYVVLLHCINYFSF